MSQRRNTTVLAGCVTAGVLAMAWATPTLGAPPPAAASGRPYLAGVSALSAKDVWVVGSLGDQFDAGGHLSGRVLSERVLIEHWNGRIWRRTKPPHLGAKGSASTLWAVSATSRSDVWAVGSLGNDTLVLRWTGKRWRHLDSPNGRGACVLRSVSSLSKSDAWAVGECSVGTAATPLIEHWNGKQWRQVAGPSRAHADRLVAVSASSPRDAWAVGSIGVTAFTQHWDGASWRREPVSGIRGASLEGVAALSPSRAWTVGASISKEGESRAFAARWNGTAWRRAALPKIPRDTGSALTSVAANGKSDVWATGYVGTEMLIEHWNGRGWKRVPAPDVRAIQNVLTAVSADSRRDAWAVGISQGALRPKQLVIRWNGTRWRTTP